MFEKWKRRFKPKKKAKASLDKLIVRSITRFRDDTGLYFPICPQCFFKEGVKRYMFFRSSRINTGVPCRDDMIFKCVKCKHTLHHGIPMYREKARLEVKLRGSPYVMRTTLEQDDEGDKIILERLRKLGYIE